MMDAVELALSEAAAVPKLMGSEDFGGTGGDVGTVVGKVQAGKSGANIPHAHASEPALRYMTPDTGRLAPNGLSRSLIAGAEVTHLHQRSGKVARSNGGSKRSRILQMEFSVNESGVEDIKGSSSVTGTCPAKSIIAAYGSKSDVFDVTKPVDELPLNELLDGSYKCPILVKDKGKVVENSNENLLHSVRKACPLLRLQSPVYTQNSADIDNSCNQMVLMGPCSSGASPSSRIDGGKADSCTVNQPSSIKDSCGYTKPPAFLVDSSLRSPKDILERLALHPSKDLDSLLLDAVKPASSSRNSSDLRLGKTVSHRTGLLPFPWSHNFFGHSKSGPDTVKLSANRITCPGRWVKVGNTLTPSKGSNGLLVDLKSLTYDHRLVPSGNLESAPLGVENASSTCVNNNSCEPVVLSSAACSASQVPPDEYSPRLLAAAQTLCDIASHSSKQNSHYMMKRLKKPSQHTMKACKLKSSQKSENLFVSPEASIRPDNLVKVADAVYPAKKLRLSVKEKTDAVSHTNTDRKVPVNWPPPRSIRSSPSKLLSDSVPEMKNYNNHIVKKSYMMTPSTRVIDKACNTGRS